MLIRSQLATRRLPLNQWRRCLAAAAEIPSLPLPDDWRSEFPIQGQGYTGRFFIRDSDLADTLAMKFIDAVPANGEGHDNIEPSNNSSILEPKQGKIVIEAYPGPGVLTRSLMKLPSSKIKKLIVLEEMKHYYKYLQPLAECDPRVHFLPLSGFQWETYTELEARGLLEDVETYEDRTTNLHFISHIPNSILGDQFSNQLLRLTTQREWLFRYGCMPMSFFLNKAVYQKVTAPPTSRHFCKLGLIATASAHTKEALPQDRLEPYRDHFYPSGNPEKKKGKGAHTVGQPVSAINIFPRVDSPIRLGMLEKWDYVARRLFVLKSTQAHKAISSLAPGANNLLKVLTDPEKDPVERVDVSKSVKDLSIREWGLIVKAFDEWPFCPEDLGVADNFYRDVERD